MQTATEASSAWHPIPARFLVPYRERDREWKRAARAAALASMLDGSVGERERRAPTWKANVWPSMQFAEPVEVGHPGGRDRLFDWLAEGRVTDSEQEWAREVIGRAEALH